MNVFPYALIRIGGGSYEDLETLHLDQTLSLLKQMTENDQHIVALRDQLVDAIFASVEGIEDERAQKKMINLKRDVFNGRPLSEAKVAFLNEHLGADAPLSDYVAAMAKTAELMTQGEASYKEETTAVRVQLQRLAGTENLRKGLVLSSQSLLKASERYAQRDVKKLKKQHFKTELSLLKYLTRIHGKTSPFSTFTHLAMGQFNESKDADAVFEGNPEAVEAVGHIRLNNYLFKNLCGLLTKHPAWMAWFRLRPNPTLTREEQNYLYLTNSNNVESFQRIPLNPVLDLFWELAAGETGGLRYKDLVAAAGEAVDASPEDLGAYISQLIEYGFLEFNYEVSGINPDWDTAWLKILETWDESIPFLSELISVLKDLREKANRYADLDSNDRITLMEEAFESFRSLFLKIHEDAGLPEEERMTPDERRRAAEKKKEEEADSEEKSEGEDSQESEEEVFKHTTSTAFNLKAEQMFYEDAALPGSIKLNKGALGPLMERMNQLYSALGEFRINLDDQSSIQHYFDGKYKEPVEMLSFYESYYRDFKKPQAEHQAKVDAAKRRKANEQNMSEEEKAKAAEEPTLEELQKEGERFKIPAHDTFRENRNAWLERYAETHGEVDRTQPLDLKLGPVHATNADDYQPEDLRTSYGLFLQPCEVKQEDGSSRVMGVLNANPYGFGKMFSRFLHIFDPAFTNAVRENNIALDPDAELLENCDASIFNANLHPTLMPYEVWMPGSQNSLPPEKHIPITEIRIGKDANGSLELRHGDKKVYVFDLGFQSPRGRSELFQLLSRFSPGRYIGYARLSSKLLESKDKEKEQPEEPQIRHTPRITFEGDMVINRETWIVPVAKLPQRQPLDTDWTYYKRVWDWKTQIGLPDEVFVCINDSRDGKEVDPEKAKKLGRDDYKPQYLSFRNPLLIRLFDKLVEKTPVAIKINEMFPSPDSLLRLGGERYITEFVIQWDTGN